MPSVIPWRCVQSFVAWGSRTRPGHPSWQCGGGECVGQRLAGKPGFVANKYPGLIGLYGGAGANTYLLYNLASAGYVRDSDLLPAAFIYDKNDHLTGRVAYKLNLRGPSVTVQTACSTSLVAVSMACQSLLNYEVDMALAGGSTIMASQKIGYMYTEGGINSPDGHCRAFDAKANGTVIGNGAGVVVLKRLKDALADGDNIWAIILGTATNNDGSLKAGYTAPSIDSQTEVIALAQGLAGVSPESITYIEAHGTGTALGDPIEIEALTKAFRARTTEKNFCAIGAVKTGIGHLDTAAGVAGLIKTALMLHHQQIPPSLHFEAPNPHLELESSPFFVNTSLRRWNRYGTTPLRAGVSSFGLSGTNAHVVMEEAPARMASGPSRSSQLLLLSAKTARALDAICANLVDFLRQNPDVNLADVAHTLRVGRKNFAHRRMLVCKNSDEAIAALQALTPDRLSTSVQESAHRPLAFMFPGQGSQFVNMGADLYQSEPTFREQVDYCSLYLQPILDVDLRSLLYPQESARDEAAKKLDQTSFTQPALFVIEYALARQLMEWGAQPTALIGHSIGEYTAACLAGVFSLDDALKLVAERGRLIQSLPGGSMLAVQMSESQLRNMLDEKLALAAVNGVGQCVVSASDEAIEQFEQELISKGIACQRLRTSHAFHSALIEPVLEPFLQLVKEMELNAPAIPFISNVTGTWITDKDAIDPHYWVKHMRQTIRFANGVEELLKDPEAILLEVGPGLTLKTLARWHPHKKPAQLIISSIPSPRERQEDVPYLLRALGHLWLAGVEPDWAAFNANERRMRVPLPTYPFDRQRYWVDMDLRSNASQLGPRSKPYNKRLEMENWFSVPAWKETPRLQVNGHQKPPVPDKSILVLADHFSLTSRFIELAKAKHQNVIWVRQGPAFRKHDEATIELNPECPEDYDALFQELSSRSLQPETIVNFWNVTPDISAKLDDLSGLGERGFFTILYLAQAIGRAGITSPLKLVLVSNGIRQVTGAEELHPEKAIVLGPCQVFPREYPNVTCQSIDITVPPEGNRLEQWLSEQLLAELSEPKAEPIVAYRDNRRWVQRYEPLTLNQASDRSAVLRDGGVYLITGGLGGLGLEVADYLSRTCRANLVLVNRSTFPAREGWSEWLQTHRSDDRVSKIIGRIRQMEESGSEVLILSADVADEVAMREVFARTRERFNELNGIIHAAGIPAGGLMQIKKPESVREVFAAKVKGTRVLEKLVEAIPLDFFVLFSSLSAIVGRLGQVDYVGANAFLDLFAHYYRAKTDRFTVSIDWSAWEQVGMAAHLFQEPLNEEKPQKELAHPLLDRRIVAEDGREVYITEFAPERQWTLDEHRIAGYPVIPGVGFFEMVRAALGERAKGRVIEFHDVFFLSVVRVGVGEKREVRLELQQDDEGFEFTVRSNPNGNGNSDESSLRNYATGRVTIHAPEPPRQYDLASFQQRCNVKEIVLTEEDRDEDLGPRWQSARRVHIGNNEIFIPLEIPEIFSGDFEHMKFHPALLDRMTGLTKKYLASGPYLPFTYKRLRIMGELPRKVYGFARYKEEESVSRETINFDLRLMDEHGRGLVEVEGFGQKQVRDVAEEIRALSALKTEGASTQLAQAPSSQGDSTSTEDLEIYKGRISPKDGVEALDRILAAQLEPQVIVCPQDLQITLEQAAKASGERFLTAVKAQQKTKLVPTNIRQHSAYVPPATDAERKITQIWQDVLGIEDVGINDSFFELGGSSLFAIQVLSRLRKEFNVEIPPAMIFEGATISALAKLLTKDQDQKPEFKEQQSRGERRKTKAQERLSQKAHTVS